MKQLILPIFLLLNLFGSVRAQDCVPDLTGIPDTAFGVFPLPFIEDERPDGGIPDTVCLNRDFEYTFSVKLGDSITVGAVSGQIVKVQLAPVGAVTYEPPLADFSYVCNPPNCVFLADSVGCIKIFGKSTNASEIGRHQAKISGTIDVIALGFPLNGLPVSFPSDQSEDLRGNYYLFVQEENSPYCQTVSSSYAVYAPDIEINNRPNPFSDFTQIYIQSKEQGRFELRVFDMLGQMLRRDPLDLHIGENIIDFDGRDLAEGLYVYTITDGRGGVSGKMAINR